MATEPPPAAPERPPPRLAGVYRLGSCFDQRRDVERFVGYQLAARGVEVPVVLARAPRAADGAVPAAPPQWPSLEWEEELRARAQRPCLPCVKDRFEEGDYRYLAIDAGEGLPLWDAWDDPSYGPFEQFAWLIQLAELLDDLHRVGVVVESLRPDQVLIDRLGRVVLDSSVALLPVPLPAGAPLRPTLSTAPELIAGGPADARSDLYAFGAVLYALQLGRELTDLDAGPGGGPIPFADRFPDAHPFLVRLLGKTFHPDRGQRFPSRAGEDLSGFEELLQTLRQAQRQLARARLEVAGWSSSGMVRDANEDALAFVHAAEAREDVVEDFAVVLLADGIAGGAAGEVAAAAAVRALRQALLHAPPFASLAEGASPTPAGRRTDPRQRVMEALTEANRVVYEAARQDHGCFGMACTAEVVFLDGRQVIVGHVGDSRTYHFHRGQLVQLTQDHSLVGRLLRRGVITPQEAETHPRRGELQQAIGGRPDVEPDVCTAPLAPGDWVLVCSDGLSQRLSGAELQDILERAPSAELAARRLVNRANRLGADDNVSVVVVRAC